MGRTNRASISQQHAWVGPITVARGVFSRRDLRSTASVPWNIKLTSPVCANTFTTTL